MLTDQPSMQFYSWDCDCGHMRSIADTEGSWCSRTAAEAEIERLTAENESTRQSLHQVTAAYDALLKRMGAVREAVGTDPHFEAQPAGPMDWVLCANSNCPVERPHNHRRFQQMHLSPETIPSVDCPACSIGNPGTYIKDGRMVCPHRPE